jgi:hypothetical protein
MRSRYVYHDKKTRCLICAKKDFIGIPIVKLRIECKHWYGWVGISSSWNIDMEIRPDYIEPIVNGDDRIFPHMNPSFMHYQNGGEREVWDESTFEPIERAKELLRRFTFCRSENERKISVAIKRIADV